MSKNPYRRTTGFKQIVYPESAPQNWMELIQAEIDKGIIKYAIISPLHNLDRYSKMDEAEASAILAGTVNMDDISSDTARLMQEIYVGMNVRAGELKKQHYHVEYGLHKKKVNHIASEYFKSLTNGTNVIARDNLRGSVRYLAHLDEDPREKAFYNPDEIIVLGDIKIDRFLDDEDKSMSTLMAWFEIEDLIEEYNVTNMYEFDKLIRQQDIDLQEKTMSNQNLRNRIRDHVKDRAKHIGMRNKRYEEVEQLITMKEKTYNIRNANLEKREKNIESQIELHQMRVESSCADLDRRRAYVEDLEEHYKSHTSNSVCS